MFKSNIEGRKDIWIELLNLILCSRKCVKMFKIVVILKIIFYFSIKIYGKNSFI